MALNDVKYVIRAMCLTYTWCSQNACSKYDFPWQMSLLDRLCQTLRFSDIYIMSCVCDRRMHDKKKPGSSTVQDYDLINFKRSSSAAFYEAATESAKTTTYCCGLENFWVDIYVSHPPLTKGYVRREKIVFKQEEKADMTSAPHKFKRKCDKLIIGHILEHM